jgi:hypothetical protein
MKIDKLYVRSEIWNKSNGKPEQEIEVYLASEVQKAIKEAIEKARDRADWVDSEECSMITTTDVIQILEWIIK